MVKIRETGNSPELEYTWMNIFPWRKLEWQIFQAKRYDCYCDQVTCEPTKAVTKDSAPNQHVWMNMLSSNLPDISL